MDFDNSAHLFRVVTLGESSVGKTSIINRLVNKEFNAIEQPTIGSTFLLHEEEVESFRIEMQIWDTAGQEKYKSLSPIYCRGAAAAVVTFDLTNRETFEKLEQWTNLVTEVSGTDTVIFVAANKCDLTMKQQVSDEEMKQWTEARGYQLVKTSAKTGDGVFELFRAVAEALYRKGSYSRFSQRSMPTLSNSEGKRCC